MTDWHPLLATTEDTPGFWRMVAQYDRTYGLIRLVKRDARLCYRAELIPRPGDEPVLLGYYPTLRQSAWEIHSKHLSMSSRPGPPNGRHDVGGSHAPGTTKDPSASRS